MTIRTKIAALTVGAIAVAGGLATAPARAAAPSSATVSAASPTATWEGSTLLPTGGFICITSSDPLCDHFVLTTRDAGVVTVSIDGDDGDDWDLYVYSAEGDLLAYADTAASGDETVTFEAAARETYFIDTAPFLVSPGATYDGTATLAAA